MDEENILAVDDFVVLQNHQSRVRIGRKPIYQVAMSQVERDRRCKAKRAAPVGRRIQSLQTTNASAIAAASTLYIRDGAVVVDATCGRGQWTRTDTARFTLVGSADFRHLPFGVDVVVLDPPHACEPDDLLELYRAGMVEAARVLKRRGRLFVKAMDQVDDHRQFWFSHELPQIAEGLGMFKRDELIVMANKTRAYSRLLIFERGR